MFSADFYSGANPGRHALVKIKFHPCALTAEAAWDILDEQDTKQNRAVWMCWLPTMFRQLRHARRIKYERIPKYVLNGEPIAGKRNLGRPQSRYWDVCKRGMKELNKWEELATDRAGSRKRLPTLTTL